MPPGPISQAPAAGVSAPNGPTDMPPPGGNKFSRRKGLGT